MANKQSDKRHLKPVPKPEPDSLTPEARLLLLQRGDPNGPIRLDCGPAAPTWRWCRTKDRNWRGRPIWAGRQAQDQT